MKAIIVGAISGGIGGFVASSLGYNVTDYQFWIVMAPFLAVSFVTPFVINRQ